MENRLLLRGFGGRFRLISEGLSGQIQTEVDLIRAEEGGQVGEVPVIGVQLARRVQVEVPVGGRLRKHAPVQVRSPAPCMVLLQQRWEGLSPTPVLHPAKQRRPQ